MMSGFGVEPELRKTPISYRSGPQTTNISISPASVILSSAKDLSVKNQILRDRGSE